MLSCLFFFQIGTVSALSICIINLSKYVMSSTRIIR